MPGTVRPVVDERDNLMAYLDQQRYGIRLTAYGLTEAQARATPTASALSVGGLIKHVTATEHRPRTSRRRHDVRDPAQRES